METTPLNINEPIVIESDVQKPERQYNLDLLRIIAMLLIVSLHYLGVGGAFFNIESGSGSSITLNYGLASLFEALAIVGVNCFVLITGYFNVTGKFKSKKVLKLYFNTIFYSLIFFVIFSCLGKFSLRNALSSVLPWLMSTYWFITVYVVLYLISPFLNKLCDNLTKKQHLTLLIILVTVFSVWKSVLPFAETLDTRKGYSLTWFVVLYLIGAYLRKYGITLFKKNIFNLLAYFAISLLSTAVKLSAVALSGKIGILAAGQNLYYHYDSITVLAASIFLFVFFSRVDIKANWLKKVIKFVGPSIFSVYLIHENFLFRETLWNGIFKANAFIGSDWFVLHFFGCVLAVFVGCIAIDQIRRLIFAGIDKSIQKKKKDREANGTAN